MLYRVVVDGTDILDHEDPTMVLLSPQLNAEIDVAGSLEFTVPSNHKYYNMFTSDSILTMTIEVWEGAVMHWFGRPMELHLDFYNNKKLYCEGGLSFFNDSVIRANEYDGELLSVIFAAVIAEHNGMVPSNRQFTVGNFTVEDTAVYRKFDYEQTSDVLKSKFLDAVEGHFFVRRVSGVNYIDFLKDMPYTCNQSVTFAENLLNFTYSFDAKDFATCVIPLGKNDAETNKPINVSDVNGGSDILVGNTASKYGKIVKVQQYSDIEDPSKLVTEGKKYLTTLQYNAFLIECSAVDLHATNGTYNQFRVGQTIHCVSNPHGINLDLPISKMTLYLDSAAKQITLGRIPKKTLARFYKEKVADNGGGGGTEPESEIPEGWEIVPPDEDGGEPTLKRVPVTIQITRVPYKSTGANAYEDGETFDPNGIIVKLVAKGLPDLEYFTDEYYGDSICPMNELSFTDSNNRSLSSGSTITWDTGKKLIWVIWRCQQDGCPYYGKTHRKGFYIENKDQLAREAAEKDVDHIKIEVPPSKIKYTLKNENNQRIQMDGAKVVAYLSDGSTYNADGYVDGVIPLNELTINPEYADKNLATGFKATSMLTSGYLEQPVSCAPVGQTVQVETSVQIGSFSSKLFETTIERTYFCPGGYCAGGREYTESWSNPGTHYYTDDVEMLIASPEPGSYTIIQKSTRIRTDSGGEDEDPEITETTYTYELNHNFTFNGKTVYYAISEHSKSYGASHKSHSVSPDNGQAPDWATGVAGNTAWTMIYGERTNLLQLITVSWPNPNGGDPLTDTFEIEIIDESGEDEASTPVFPGTNIPIPHA